MKRLKIRRLIWTEVNIKHIARHEVETFEVEEAIESEMMIREARDGRYAVVGVTEAGRVLTIILEEVGRQEYFPVTAHTASRRMRRAYQTFLEEEL